MPSFQEGRASHIDNPPPEVLFLGNADNNDLISRFPETIRYYTNVLTTSIILPFTSKFPQLAKAISKLQTNGVFGILWVLR
jgi:hypothetical protein